MRIDKPRRGKKAAKRFDPSDLRHLMRDHRQWCSIGVVVAPTDGSPHYRLDMDGADALDVLVEIVLQPSQEPVTARLSAGMFMIPAIGEEVAVIVPSGETSFMPVIACILSSNIVPTTQGPSPTRIVLVRGEVLIHDGTGGAEPLVRKSDFDGHTHPLPELVGTTTYGVIPDPVLHATGGAADVDGTSVLKAK